MLVKIFDFKRVLLLSLKEYSLLLKQKIPDFNKPYGSFISYFIWISLVFLYSKTIKRIWKSTDNSKNFVSTIYWFLENLEKRISHWPLFAFYSFVGHLKFLQRQTSYYLFLSFWKKVSYAFKIEDFNIPRDTSLTSFFSCLVREETLKGAHTKQKRTTSKAYFLFF